LEQAELAQSTDNLKKQSFTTLKEFATTSTLKENIVYCFVMSQITVYEKLISTLSKSDMWQELLESVVEIMLEARQKL
jgi:hypothetical protein